MPVWHEKTAPFRRSGELLVMGITQEQHPDRCRLYAQWQGIDWPILWDPFNLTGSSAVPIAMAVDESGVVRNLRLDPRRFEEQFLEGFLAMEFPAASAQPADPFPLVRPERAQGAARPSDRGAEDQLALARCLWHAPHGTDPLDADGWTEVLETLHAAADGPQGSPAQRFRLGVAHRLRYDSRHHQAQDFQASVDHWMTALIADPGQYIWRRRIQQWGPRLDKPYPFYDWVAQAREAVAARGDEPVNLRVPLTGSEVAGSTNEIPQREVEAVHPDPGRKVPRDGRKLIAVETAAALHTGVASRRVREPVGTSRVHLVLRPDPERDVHWSNEAGPTQVWISVPEGWNLRRNLQTLAMPAGEAQSAEVRTLDFEVRPPAGSQSSAGASLHGVAFYYVCEGATGECLYLAQDFEVPIPNPGPTPGAGR